MFILYVPPHFLSYVVKKMQDDSHEIEDDVFSLVLVYLLEYIFG
jgi:hypothetical protein